MHICEYSKNHYFFFVLFLRLGSSDCLGTFCRPAWTHKSTCICLLGAGIKSVPLCKLNHYILNLYIYGELYLNKANFRCSVTLPIWQCLVAYFHHHRKATWDNCSNVLFISFKKPNCHFIFQSKRWWNRYLGSKTVRCSTASL